MAERTAPAPGCVAVDSEQRLRLARPVVERSEAGGAALGRRYWEEVERVGRGLLRCRQTAAGVELRLLGRTVLLAFGPAEIAVDATSVTCTHPITGGLLARCPGGAISFRQAGDEEVELSTAVTGYVPRLAAGPGGRAWTGVLYPLIQRRIHDALGRRYFERMTGAART